MRDKEGSMLRGWGVHIKILESYPVVCIWPLQNSLKHHKVIPRDETAFCGVRNAEEGRKLGSSNLGAQIGLGRDRVDELLGAQVPVIAAHEFPAARK